MTKPNILSRSFAYTPSSRQTVEHLRAIFARARRELREQQAKREEVDANKVKPIKARVK